MSSVRTYPSDTNTRDHSINHPAEVQIEREQCANALGQYLVEQLDQAPELAYWIALDLVAHVVRIAKNPGYPGAMRALIDTTGDVETLVTLTPAGPPTPPAHPENVGGRHRGRRRWWGWTR
ncbi:MAG: hypothetical protein HOV96_19545 [Nonomuraea sp.]|nr:hypothetical protein [Nonomuraea sp.]